MPRVIEFDTGRGIVTIPDVVSFEALRDLVAPLSAPPWQSLIGRYRLSVSHGMPVTAGPIMSGDVVLIPTALDEPRWPRPWNPPRFSDEEYAAMLVWLQSKGVRLHRGSSS